MTKRTQKLTDLQLGDIVASPDSLNQCLCLVLEIKDLGDPQDLYLGRQITWMDLNKKVNRKWTSIHFDPNDHFSVVVRAQ